MPATARALTRLTARTPPINSTLRLTATYNPRLLAFKPQTFQFYSRRGYASGNEAKPSRTGYYAAFAALAAAGGAGYFYLNNGGVTDEARARQEASSHQKRRIISRCITRLPSCWRTRMIMMMAVTVP